MVGAQFTIEPMKEEDLPRVVEIENEAFLGAWKKFLPEIPSGKREGHRVVNRFFRPGCASIVLRDEAGTIQGVEFVQKMGTRSVIGPGAVWPGYQTKGAGACSIR